ncbi:MAG: c-type cytochrome [Solirubrobacteraceae bacterium]|nr:c-type cytochrome [Solirubrobacteraceae bacterium]
MIAAAAFVIGFLFLGFAVALTAMRGGPRGAREAMHTQSARGRTTATGIIAAVAVVFGIGIPAAVLASNGDNNETTHGGVKLTADQTAGRKLFTANCGTCHTLAAAQTTGRVGPNFDELRPPKALVLDAIAKGRANGRGQMPAGLLVGKDAQDVASFLAAVAGH